MEDKVIFTGSVTNVEDYLQAMDVFVLPSRFEGLGIVAIEAQCSGLPVIGSYNLLRDINITGNVTYINLEENLGYWTKIILSLRQKKRQNWQVTVNKKGYDLAQIAVKVRKLYNG